jgi:hypothetical protein
MTNFSCSCASKDKVRVHDLHTTIQSLLGPEHEWRTEICGQNDLVERLRRG